MKNKFVFTFFGMFFLLVFSSFSSSVECGSVPVDGCSLLSNKVYVFDNGIYNLNGSDLGAIDVSGSNVILDCQNSILYGDYNSSLSVNSRGIDIASSLSNVTIKNCELRNYYEAVRVFGNNNSIKNNTFIDNARGVLISSISYDNILVKDSIFVNNSFSGIYVANYNGNNLTLDGGKFISHNQTSSVGPPYGIYVFNSPGQGEIKNIFFDFYTRGIVFSSSRPTNFWQIENNSFSYFNNSDSSRYMTREIDLIKTSNINLTRNFCNYSAVCFRVQQNSTDIFLYRNEINNSDWGISFTDSSNLFLDNNFFNNNTASYDTYNTGIGSFRNITNLEIKNNIVKNIFSAGISVQRSYNVSIINNTFDFIPISQQLVGYGAPETKGAHHQGYPEVAIQITPSWMSWLNDGIYIPQSEYNEWNSSLVNISGNVFDSDTQIYLWDIGTSQLSYDLPENNYLKMWLYTDMEYPSQFFVNKNFKNLTSIDRVSNSANITLTNNLAYGHQHGNSPQEGNRIYWRYLDYGKTLFVKNVNSTSLFNNTGNTGVYETIIYNLSNAFIQFDNGTSAILNGWSQNYSLTLNPNQSVYIYLNYSNISSGVVSTSKSSGGGGSGVIIKTNQTANSTLMQNVSNEIPLEDFTNKSEEVTSDGEASFLERYMPLWAWVVITLGVVFVVLVIVGLKANALLKVKD